MGNFFLWFFVSTPSPGGDCVATKPSRLLLQNEGGGRGSGSRMARVWLSDGAGLALRHGSISLSFCGYAIAPAME